MTKNRLDLSSASEEDVKKEIERLNDALENGMLWPKKHKLYLHGCKESNWETARELGLSDDGDNSPSRNFAYCCYEMSLDLEIHQDGSAYATHFNGVELKEKVRV
jgi:hypothetical protein